MTTKDWLKPAAAACSLAMVSACGGGSGGSGPDNPLADTTPDAFSFQAVDNLFLEIPVTSNSVTVTGIDAPAPISISDGASYSINNGAFTSAAGEVAAGDTVRMRVTSSKDAEETVSAVVDIGGVTASFDVATGPGLNVADTSPVFFDLPEPDVATVNKGATVISAPFTVTGINAATSISITGGEYRVERAEFTADSGVVHPGEVVEVKAVAPANDGDVHVATLTVGNVSEHFVLATPPAAGANDTMPDFFSFEELLDAEPGIDVLSGETAISGLSGSAPITVTGGEYSLDGGATFTATPGEVINGSGVMVRTRSSTTSGGIATARIDIGGVPGDFVVVTREVPPGSDIEPDLGSFIFEPVETGKLGSAIESEWRQPSGFDAPAQVSVEGGEYQISGGGFGSEPQLMRPGQSIRVRGNAPETVDESHSVNLAIGGVVSEFEIHSVANNPPDLSGVGIFQCDTHLFEGQNEICLDASEAGDPDEGDRIELITWAQVIVQDEPELEIRAVDGNNAPGAFAAAEFKQSGVYTFKVTASDGDLESQREFSIEVFMTAPTSGSPQASERDKAIR